MKAAVLLILALAIAAAATMQREASRLKQEETELQSRGATTGPGAESSGDPPDSALLPAKRKRRGKPAIELKAYLAKYREMYADGKIPSEEEQRTTELELGFVPPRDLARLPLLLEEAGVPAGYHRYLYQYASSRLVEYAPDLATEFALKGRDIRCFNFVIRQWISQDPVAAGAWLRMKSLGDPPLDANSLDTYPGYPEPLDVPRLLLAAGIAAAPGGEDVSTLMDLEGSKLTEALQDVAKVIPPAGLPALLKRMGESGRTDLIVTTLKHYPEAALAREHLESSGLPPDQFLKAATTIVAGLDPVDMGRGIAWFQRCTDPAMRDAGMKEIVTAWTHENPRSLKAWLDQLPPGSDRQAAAAAYAEAVKHPRKRLPPDPF